jgi:hypothetical protein
LSAKLTAVALDIAGPIYVEQTQITKEVLNDFATRTDDLDDFLPVVPTQASNTPSIGSLPVNGDRPKPTSTQAGDRPSTSTKRPNPDTAVYDAGPKRRKTKTPKPSHLAFRSRDQPDDIIMALSEVQNWDDFVSRSDIPDDEMVYIGWDGLDEEKPCCTAEEWNSRLEEYCQGRYTGLYVHPQTNADFQSDAG